MDKPTPIDPVARYGVLLARWNYSQENALRNLAAELREEARNELEQTVARLTSENESAVGAAVALKREVARLRAEPTKEMLEAGGEVLAETFLGDDGNGLKGLGLTYQQVAAQCFKAMHAALKEPG